MYGQYQGVNRMHNSGYNMSSGASSSYQPPSYPAAHASQYAQMYQSPHYAAAYGEAQAVTGISSQTLTSYNPSTRSQPAFFTPPQNSSSWYSPGTCRCTYQDCNFIGSANSLEVHRMDRHLIYPPGWKERKKRPDWDADPSLIGKPIPVQGTGLVLDTQDKIDAWILERKQRWPSKGRVEDKHQKREEAIARGQLDFVDTNSRKRKRPEDGQDVFSRGRGRGGGRGRGRGNDRHQQGRRPILATTTSVPAVGPSGLMSLPAKPSEAVIEAAIGTENSLSAKVDDSLWDYDSDDDNGPPEILTTKAPTNLPPLGNMDDKDDLPSTNVSSHHVINTPPPTTAATIAKGGTSKALQKSRPQAPRRPPPNPFAPKQSLLRNLLLPEIRMTVSNLSQAIRFLVDNDFLENVELQPGQAAHKMIEVIEERATTSAPNSDPAHAD